MRYVSRMKSSLPDQACNLNIAPDILAGSLVYLVARGTNILRWKSTHDPAINSRPSFALRSPAKLLYQQLHASHRNDFSRYGFSSIRCLLMVFSLFLRATFRFPLFPDILLWFSSSYNGFICPVEIEFVLEILNTVVLKNRHFCPLLTTPLKLYLLIFLIQPHMPMPEEFSNLSTGIIIFSIVRWRKRRNGQITNKFHLMDRTMDQ